MLNKKEIVIFGAGRRAEIFMVQNYNIQVSYIMDNNKEGHLYNYEIKKPYYDESAFVIVTVDGVDYYGAIQKQLLGLGYKEFIDFIPYTIYGKKMALAYGNCHIEAIRRYLEMSKEFSKMYGFYPLQSIFNMDNVPSQDIVSHADLILHQSVRLNNVYGECFASERVLMYTKKDARVIALPNLYGLPSCFFPQLSKSGERKLNHPLSIGHDINIERWTMEGRTIDEIVDNILDGTGKTYSKLYIQEMWNIFLQKVKNREKQWDIKVQDYIIHNYQSQKLFSDTWHISTEFAKVIAKRTLKYLEMCSDIEGIIPCLDDYEVFMYEDVKKALGIQWKENIIRKYTRDVSCAEKNEMDLFNYVELCVNEIRFENCIHDD